MAKQLKTSRTSINSADWHRAIYNPDSDAKSGWHETSYLSWSCKIPNDPFEQG